MKTLNEVTVGFENIDKIDILSDLANNYEYNQLNDLSDLKNIPNRHDPAHYRFDINLKRFEIENIHFDFFVTFYLNGTEKVHFKNCIFENGVGIVSIGIKNTGLESVYIYKSVADKIRIGGNKMDCKEIWIDTCAVKELSIDCENVSLVDFFRSEIREVNFESKNVRKITDRGNYLGIFKIYGTSFNEVSLSLGSFSLIKNKLLNLKINDFVNNTDKKQEDQNDLLSEYSPENIGRKYILNFYSLLEKSDHHSFLGLKSSLRYCIIKNKKYGKLQYCFLYFFGFFMKPLKIILAAIIIITIFSVLYYFCFDFCFLQSIEASIKNFFTMGYPKEGNEYIILFAITESFLGLFTTSSLLLSVINKYRLS